MQNSPAPERISSYPSTWAAEDPRRIAVDSATAAHTYADLADSIQGASSLLTALGLGNGDRLLIVAENSPPAMVTMLAAMESGVIPAIANARLTGHELSSIIEKLKPSRILFVTSGSENAANHAHNFTCQPVAGNVFGDALLSTVLLDKKQARDTAIMDPNIACFVLTSGSTGAPKCVALSHSALIHMGRLPRHPQVSSVVSYYIVSPLAHILGLGSNLIPAIVAGARVELVSRFKPTAMLEAISSRSITHFACVPAVYSALLRCAKDSGISTVDNGLVAIRSAGAPLNLELKAGIEKLFGIPLENGYGMTECNAISRTEEGITAAGSVGRANPGNEVRVCDENGAELPTGTIGRLAVRSPCLATGLWTGLGIGPIPEISNGWLDTGDLAYLDPERNIFIVGRFKEMIIRSGFNVMPGDVERAIFGHESVAGCAVVGCPAEYDDTRIVAFVALLPGFRVSEEQLKVHCRSQLAGYKCPSQFIFLDEIPLMPNGKVDTTSLLDIASKTDSVPISTISAPG